MTIVNDVENDFLKDFEEQIRLKQGTYVKPLPDDNEDFYDWSYISQHSHKRIKSQSKKYNPKLKGAVIVIKNTFIIWTYLKF